MVRTLAPSSRLRGTHGLFLPVWAFRVFSFFRVLPSQLKIIPSQSYRRKGLSSKLAQSLTISSLQSEINVSGRLDEFMFPKRETGIVQWLSINWYATQSTTQWLVEISFITNQYSVPVFTLVVVSKLISIFCVFSKSLFLKCSLSPSYRASH